MKNKNNQVIQSIICLLALAVVVSSVTIPMHWLVSAQSDSRQQDCEQIKKEITTLQDALSEETALLRRLEESHEEAAKTYKEIFERFKTIGSINDDLHSDYLEMLREVGETQRKLGNQIEEAKATIQAIKDLIADLLNKLGTCGAKSVSNPSPAPPPSKTQTPSTQTPPLKPTTPLITLNGVPGEPEDCAEFRRNYNFQKNALSQTNLSPQDRERFEKALENSRRGYCQCLIKNHITPLPDVCQDTGNTPQSNPTPTPTIPFNGLPGEPEDCAEFRRNYNYQKNALSQTGLSDNDRQRFEKALENSRRGYCQCLIKNHITPLPQVCQDIAGNPQATSSPTPQPTPTPARNANNQVGYHVGTNTANGLFVTTFDTPHGTIKVNLTDDVSAGDTITGTVETEPNGKNDQERAQNQAELNGYVIELSGQKTNVSDKKITCIIPATLAPDTKTIGLIKNNQPVATSECPISPTPPPTPTQTTLPTGGQQGKPIECNGNFSTNDPITIGGIVMPEIAGSPRKKVVRNTSESLGPTTIKVANQECPFRNIGIKLSAPKLSLLRGETTTLHVVVLGLAGITGSVPLDLINNSPSVIRMAGGDEQHITIQPTQVQPDGAFSLDRTLTGIMSGGFGITATVKWSNVCTLNRP